MNLGQFSVSLTVKDITASLRFYECLGFKPLPSLGSIEDKWLILQNGTTVIGLFEGMLEHNILTFNPENARAIESKLKNDGIAISKTTEGDTGPAHFILEDPDGNSIMFDQHQ